MYAEMMLEQLLERVLEATRFDPSAHLPLSYRNRRVGWLQPGFADVLLVEHSGAFSRDAQGVRIVSAAHLQSAVLSLAASGWIGGWRNECYAVRCGAEVLFKLERAAFRRLGMLASASHLNGWVRVNPGAKLKLWVARRHADKPVDPGMLDNLVGGGIAADSTPAATLAKECDEEAGIASAVARSATAAGSLRITRAVANGVHDEIIHVFDLELPPDFAPSNRDGEVAEFLLLEPDEVTRRLADGEFTVDACAVAVDFLSRQGVLEDRRLGAAIKDLRAGPQ